MKLDQKCNELKFVHFSYIDWHAVDTTNMTFSESGPIQTLKMGSTDVNIGFL